MLKVSLICIALFASFLAPMASAQTDVGGRILVDTTWDLAGSPYTVVSTITVSADATLTVDPGVEVRVSPGLALTIGRAGFGSGIGTLRVLGTAADPVLFTSSGATTAGSWNDIFFTQFAAPESILRFAIIEFAGGAGAGTGSVTITDSQPLIENTIIRDSAQSGIWANFTAGSLIGLTITSCTFERCISSTDGGGIRIANGAAHQITESTFSQCQAGGHGGGISVESAADVHIGTVNLSNCSAGGVGGGIRVHLAADMLIDNSTLSDCSAVEGGGIDLNNSFRFKLLGTVIAHGQATNRGGGLRCVNSFEMLIDDCTFEDNNTTSASTNLGGGGVWWDNCDAGSTLSNCVFTNNRSGSRGGGLFILNSSSAQILGNIFTDNNARTDNAAFRGGAVYHQNSSSPTYRGNTFEKNRAGGAGGAVFFNDTVNTPIVFDDNIVVANESLLALGGGVVVNGLAPNSTFSNSHFLRNKALGPGQSVGALHVRGVNTRISDCRFEFNAAEADVGALNIEDSAGFIIERSTFRENSAGNQGGAIFVRSNSPSGFMAGDEISGTFNTFHGNTAAQGSAIFYAVVSNPDGSGDLDASFTCWGVETEDEVRALLLWDNCDDPQIGIVFESPLAPCNPPCHADTNDDTFVNVTDLLTLLASWGECAGLCRADFDGSATVNVTDLLTLLAAWGPCP